MSLKIDIILIGALFLLVTLGTTILFAVAPQIFPLQLFYLGLAVAAFFLVSRLDEIILVAVSKFVYLGVVVLLIVTFIIGEVSHGAIRWLPLGPLTLQPSELAKPAVALITAWLLSRKKSDLLVSFLLFLPPAILTFIQPDLGTTLMLAFAWFGAVISSNIEVKKLLRLLLFFSLLAPLIWFLLAPYQRERLVSFLSPQTDPAGAAYQSRQAQITAGSGGLFGRGLGQGSQTQLAFLPARHTDFVFASVGEELGFVGMGLVLGSFFVVFWRILRAFSLSETFFSRSVIGGIFLYLFAQTFVNISMNLGLLPVAGVPLPFISAGGSSLISTMIALGIVEALKKS